VLIVKRLKAILFLRAKNGEAEFSRRKAIKSAVDFIVFTENKK
jgi:hypothetical protein